MSEEKNEFDIGYGMITLKQGEKIHKVFEVKKSKHGKGAFYISNYGISFLSQKKGTVIDLDWRWIRSYQPIKKDKVLISWDDDVGNRWNYEFKVESSEQVVHELQVANEEYASSMSEFEAIKMNYGNQANVSITSEEEQSSSFSPPLNIPEYVTEDKIWNDCWFDEKRNAYITHNEFHKKAEGIRERPTQIQYEQETGDDGIVINPDKIKMIHGIPAIKLTVTKGGLQNWVLLPTMREDMLTKDIVEHRIDVHEPSNKLIHYTTVAKKEYTFGGRFGEGLTEMEYCLGKDLKIYVFIDPKEIKNLEKVNPRQ